MHCIIVQHFGASQSSSLFSSKGMIRTSAGNTINLMCQYGSYPNSCDSRTRELVSLLRRTVYQALVLYLDLTHPNNPETAAL